MDWAEIIEWKFFNIFLFSVKIARKNTPKMMREASSVSVGYAIKMRQIQDEEEEEDDDDYRQRLRRRWEQCPITKPTPPPPSPSSSLRKWKSWVLSAKYKRKETDPEKLSSAVQNVNFCSQKNSSLLEMISKQEKIEVYRQFFDHRVFKSIFKSVI